MTTKQKTGIFLLFDYAVQIGKERGFGKGRFFFLKALLFPRAAANWVSFADSYFKRIGFGSAPWDVIATPLRLCLSNNFSAAKRAEMMQSHYEILEKNFSNKFLNLFLVGVNTKIASVTGKSGCAYEFTMCYSLIWRREGLLTIFMKDASGDDLILSTLTFTLFKNEQGGNSLLIGGLQGVPTRVVDGKALVVKSTRDLQGLRPKYAVLNCAYAVASRFCVTEIIATSSTNHSVQLTNKRRGQQDFHADYDTFWQEVGGTLRADKNFALPLVLPKKNAEDILAKKKKDWLARYVHIDTIVDQTKESLGSMLL